MILTLILEQVKSMNIDKINTILKFLGIFLFRKRKHLVNFLFKQKIYKVLNKFLSLFFKKF